MMRSIGPIVMALLVSMLAACAFERPTSDVPMSFDFGPTPQYTKTNPAIPATILVTPVRAPAWLEDNGIAYRLLYEDSARPRIYASNRWVAEPDELFAERLRNRLAAAAKGVVTPAFSARSDYTLRIELDDFSQHFSAPGQSRAVVRLRASLLQTERRTLLAQRMFEASRETTPNPAGAVKGLSDATEELIEALVKWTAENAQVTNQR